MNRKHSGVFSLIVGVVFWSIQSVNADSCTIDAFVGVQRTGLDTSYEGNGNVDPNLAELSYPVGLYSPACTSDGSDQLLIADSDNGFVRGIDLSSLAMSKFAGSGLTSGTQGEGDDGPATSNDVGLKPWHMCGDTAGTIFVVDKDNSLVRKVSRDGIISTFAGVGGTPTTTTTAVSTTAMGDGGPATSAMYHFLSHCVVDTNGDVLLTATNDYKVRKVIRATGISTWFAGTGRPSPLGVNDVATSSTLTLPYTMFLDPSGQLLISEYGQGRVRAISATGSGIMTTVVGFKGDGSNKFSGNGGPATSAGFSGQYSNIAVNAVGDIFIASNQNMIRYVKKSTGIVDELAGFNNTAGFSGNGGSAIGALLSFPHSMVVRGNTIYVSESGNNIVRKLTCDFDLGGSTATTAMCPTDPPTETPTLNPTMSPTLSLSPSEAPTASPSMSPTYSHSPSMAPSQAPTAAPSAVPSLVPSATPSVAPTAAPSVVPSLAPSATPSVAPTAAPSAAPSLAPSATPSVAPTAAPSAAPSLIPTVVPSEDPTAVPSAAPSLSFAPTLPIVDISFDTAVYLHNATAQVLDGASQKAVVAAVAKTLEFNDWQESERRQLATGRKHVVFVSQRHVSSVSPTSHQIETVVNIEASTADFADTVNDADGAVLYNRLTQALETAVNTQAFTQTVRNMSVHFNAPVTMFVGQVNLTMTEYTIVERSSTDSSENDLSEGELAGVVIGVVLGFLLCVVALYFCCANAKDGKTAGSDEKQQQEPSQSADGYSSVVVHDDGADEGIQV